MHIVHIYAVVVFSDYLVWLWTNVWWRIWLYVEPVDCCVVLVWDRTVTDRWCRWRPSLFSQWTSYNIKFPLVVTWNKGEPLHGLNKTDNTMENNLKLAAVKLKHRNYSTAHLLVCAMKREKKLVGLQPLQCGVDQMWTYRRTIQTLKMWGNNKRFEVFTQTAWTVINVYVYF